MDSEWHHVETPFADVLLSLGVENCFHSVLAELTGSRADYLKDIDLEDLEGQSADGAPITKPVARGIIRKLQAVQTLAEARSTTAPTTPVEEARQAVQVLSPLPAPAPLAEVVIVCIDRSGSMGTPFSTERTRMEAVKQMFYAFRDRTECLGKGAHRIGLIQFDSQVERILEPTDQLDVFEAVVDKMEKRGSTAVFSAIAEAAEMLGAFPDVDKRVLALTDGQNNSGLAAQDALNRVNEVGAVVDAILVGNQADSNLRKIVSATGGECFQINDLGEGFELLEAEAAVSLRARGERPKRIVCLDDAEEKHMTATAAAPAPTPIKVTSASEFKGAVGGGVAKRVQKELKSFLESSPSGIHIFPSEDLRAWRILLEGPAGSPFESGTFVLRAEFPDDYPFKPPKMRFETPIYHCNISDSGAICLDVLRDNWGPHVTVHRALMAVVDLLQNPNTDDALRSWIAEVTIAHQRSQGADRRYMETAQQKTAQDASRSVQEWRKEWGCE